MTETNFAKEWDMFWKKMTFFVCASLLSFSFPCHAEDAPKEVAAKEIPQGRADETIEIKNEYAVDSNYDITIENLIGNITLDFSDQNKVVSTACIHAHHVVPQKAKELAQSVKIEATGDQKKISIVAIYPLLEHSLYYMSPKDKSGKKSSSHKSKESLVYQEKEVTFFTEQTPSTAHLSVDMHLSLPKNATVQLKNAVGSIIAKGIQGDLVLDTHSATIKLENGTGVVRFSTTNGAIDIKAQAGEISGYTGSGKIELTSCTASAFQLDSGSGAIILEKCTGSLIATNGSGRVVLDDMTAGKVLKIQTGSGNIRVKGDCQNLSSLFVRSGSGDVNFYSTPFPKLSFTVTSGSGEIDVEVPELKVHPVRGKMFIGSIQSGENGDASIGTGSGDVRLTTKKERQYKKDRISSIRRLRCGKAEETISS